MDDGFPTGTATESAPTTVRNAWQATQAPSTAPHVALSNSESNAVAILRTVMTSAEKVGFDVDAIIGLIESANLDLTAGCEMARLGYLKQAYQLYRSWLEQGIFAIYFLEATLHREAWAVIDEISDYGKEPQTKLMLHELLDENKHHFARVYVLRYKALQSHLKISNSKETPVKLARHCLIDLSQGVHGTYRPRTPTSADELTSAIDRHIIELFERTSCALGMIGFLSIFARIGPSSEELVQVRGPGPVSDEMTPLKSLLGHLEAWQEHVREKGTR